MSQDERDKVALDAAILAAGVWSKFLAAHPELGECVVSVRINEMHSWKEIASSSCQTGRPE